MKLHLFTGPRSPRKKENRTFQQQRVGDPSLLNLVTEDMKDKKILLSMGNLQPHRMENGRKK